MYNIKFVLSRKIITASITGSIFAILYALINPDLFGRNILTLNDYFHAFVSVTPILLLYGFPVILVYGGITSIISEYTALFITKHTFKQLIFYISFLFHILFGLILSWPSLIAAITFFLVDFILLKSNIYKWETAFKSLVFPISTWLIFTGLNYILSWVGN